MKLSVVSTLYKSKPFLEEFLLDTIQSIQKLGITEYEIVFVNDGSPDDSLNYLIDRKKELPHIVVVDLSRNFGHHYAMQAGLEVATGDYIFLIDNDLEVMPNFMIDCFDKINTTHDIDVVYGYQTERKGEFVESIGGKIFWWALNKFSDVKVPKNLVTERLMTKRYKESLLSLGDANLFLGGMMHWAGYNQIGIPIVKSQRKGKSTYSSRKRFELMIQAITSFSGKPLEYLFYSGILITILSIFSIVYIITKKIIYGNIVQLGWTSIIATNFLILGIISMFIGLIGIYVYKIFRQVQNRPNHIIKKIYR